MTAWLLILSLVFLIQAQDNFQTRVVFYGSPLDSVCWDTIEYLDTINIKALFNGTTMREIKNVHGQTYCDDR
jgi:hypothetical protein